MELYRESPAHVRAYIRVLFVALLAGLAFGAFALGFHFVVLGVQKVSRPEFPRQFNVTGEGKVVIRPDIALFTSGVTAQALAVADAQLENTRRTNAMVEFLKQNGVEERDLKTIQYSITPIYRSEVFESCVRFPCPGDQPATIVAYRVQTTVEVRVRKLEEVDELLTGVVKNGANEVGEVRFTIDDEEAALREARELAIQDAREKAVALARDLDVRLGDLVSFFEQGPVYPIYGKAASFGGGDIPEAAPAPSIEPGEQEVTSVVNVTYEFR